MIEIKFTQNGETKIINDLKSLVFLFWETSTNNKLIFEINQKNAVVINDVMGIQLKDQNKKITFYMVHNPIVVKNNDVYSIHSTKYWLISDDSKILKIKKERINSLKYRYKFFNRKLKLGLTLHEMVDMNKSNLEYKEGKIFEYISNENSESWRYGRKKSKSS